mmetsp:Transcript_30045/g.77095  ORF Transcript_30045/g.77095 Transcript_30045/m.77095 type:complete len:372 (+) Transcript_30045:342-1457(+)
MSAAISSSHCSGNFRTAPRVHGVVYSRQHALATLGWSRCSRLPSRVTGAQKLPRWTAKRQARENFASSRTAALPDTPSIQDLNKTYGIPGSVSITEGHNGLPMVLLTHECGSSAAVYLYGACVASWKQISDDEVLFMRPDAVFDKTKPISGGIPHCFPQFGPGVMQQHGFARNLDWTVSSTSADLQPDEKDPEVELVLSDNEYTRSMWDHSFKLVYSVSLHGEELRTAYRVINTDDKPFEFTAALHSYFEVAGIQNATVRGLKGLTYLDKVVDAANPPSKEQTSESLSFSGPTDSVFLEAPEYLELDVGTGAAIAMSSTGWTDAVVWNPWEVMPSCYESFCCVENAAVSNPIKLAPGESWAAQTDFKVIDL